ncbi:protein phosphatase 2C domain-containing protein [Cellulomonas sp. NPDC089187]|uniref:PP2C family protein-serine/threonine phosphatase n=1 Tax=Cellulomonas sp. NPDC089187 TaxID=3154970 RepID=UPI003433A878
MPVTLDVALRSETGPHRSGNQDSVGASVDYALVADGVGGNVGGDIASWTFTHRVMSTLATRPARTFTAENIAELIATANAEIGHRIRREPELEGMATTVTALFCGEDSVRVGHLGDSRAYLVRDGVGYRVTRDDSYVQMLVDSGAVDPADARTHPLRNVILRSLSGRSEDTTDLPVMEVPVQSGDRWLVTSDGLTDYVEEERIIGILTATPDREDAADALLAAALAADSRDNISLVVADVALDTGETQGARPYRFLGAAAGDDLGAVVDLSR